MTAPRWPLNGKGTTAMVAGVIGALLLVFQFLGAIPWEPKGSVAKAEERLRAEFQREQTLVLGQINDRLKRLEDALLGPGR